MSWFGAGASQFDDIVERATSELLPQGQEDLALNLEICDQVRSKQVQPKDAIRALRKRLGHKNPNVQLLALKLTDTIVKNGGNHFLVQVASREFLEDYVSIIRQPATNSEVKSKALGYLQSWASALQGKPEFSSVTEHVRNLKADHFIFPEPSLTPGFMVDTSAAPDWTDSDVCMRCRTAFTMTNRKHHCRNCGQTFCGACSSKSIPLPRLGINQAVRVCDGCYAKDWAKSNLTGHSSLSTLTGGSEPSHMSPRASSQRADEDEDDDLRRAIEASLKETGKGKTYAGDGGGGGGRGGYMPPQQEDALKAPGKANSEEDDPDLAAAIAASLRDVRINDRNTEAQLGIRSTCQESLPKVTPFNDLSPTEKENISMFADLVERIHEIGGDVVSDRQIQELYELIGSLQPKLIRALEDTIGKHKTYYDLHEQISRAVKMYDSLLEQRLSSYGQPPTHQQQSSGYAGSSSLAHTRSAATKPTMYSSPYPEAPSATAPYHTPTTSSFSPYTIAGEYRAALSSYQPPAVLQGYQQSLHQQPQNPEQPYPLYSAQQSSVSQDVSASAHSVSGQREGSFTTVSSVSSAPKAAQAPHYGYPHYDSAVQRHGYSGETSYGQYHAVSGAEQPTPLHTTYVPVPGPPHAQYEPPPPQQQQQQLQEQPERQRFSLPKAAKEEAPLIEF